MNEKLRNKALHTWPKKEDEPKYEVIILADKEYKEGEQIRLGEVEGNNKKLFENVTRTLTDIPFFTLIAETKEIKKPTKAITTKKHKADELKTIRKKQEEKKKTKSRKR